MAQLIDADYSLQWLLPPSLEELVPQDHPARFIREYVESLDLAALGLADEPAEEGRPAYAKGLLLKVWLYGYWRAIRSTRQLERACREHLSLLWLTGMHQPDHNTLWRFWAKNREQVRRLHRQSVHLAMEAGLVSLALTAVDGTKIEAVASGQSGWKRQRMEKVLTQLDRELDQREGEIERAEPKEQGEYRLPASLSERQALRQAVVEGLAELERSGRQHYHPQEPEAHRMKCGGANRYAYNAQAVADEKAGIILAGEVGDQENDVGQLALMLEAARQVVEEVGSEGNDSSKPAAGGEAGSAKAPAEVSVAVEGHAVTIIGAAELTASPQAPSAAVVAPPLLESTPRVLRAVADTGYGAGADIAAAQKAGFDVVVPTLEGKPKGKNPYHASQFKYQGAEDVCLCPRGEVLPFERQKDRRGQWVRVYRCRCKDCPVRLACTKDKRGRMIEIDPHHDTVVAMREKLASPEGQARFKQRARIIEPRFARIKAHQGFRRWTVRGLAKVRSQWAWVCLTTNLQVLFGAWLSGALKLS